LRSSIAGAVCTFHVPVSLLPLAAHTARNNTLIVSRIVRGIRIAISDISLPYSGVNLIERLVMIGRPVYFSTLTYDYSFISGYSVLLVIFRVVLNRKTPLSVFKRLTVIGKVERTWFSIP
jgi:hypothetical protein